MKQRTASLLDFAGHMIPILRLISTVVFVVTDFFRFYKNKQFRNCSSTNERRKKYNRSTLG